MKELIKSPYIKLFLLGLVALIVASYFSEGFHQPDEHYQILEFCNYKLGNTPAGDLPWEFRAKIRPAIQPYMAFIVVKALSLIGIKNPFTWAFMLRLLTALFAWFIVCKMSLLLLSDFVTEKGKKLFIFMALLLWFVPYIYVRFSSDTVGGLTFLASIYVLLVYLKKYAGYRFMPLLLTGLFLGFSFFLRFQIATAFIGLGIWMIFVRKMKWREIWTILLGYLIASLFCIYLDYRFYQSFEITPYNYFHYFLIGNAARFGVAPWWSYFSSFVKNAIPPIGILLLLAFIYGIYKKPLNILSLCTVSFVVCHIMITHKELRFLFPMLFSFTYLVSIGIDSFMAGYKVPKWLTYTFYTLILMNFPLLAYRTLVPAQEYINYEHFLYTYTKHAPATLLCNEGAYNDLMDPQAHFYNQPQLHVVELKNDSAVAAYLRRNEPDKFLVFTEGAQLHAVYKGYSQKRIYCLYPPWISKYNFDDWQSRVHIYVWSIYELSRPAKS